MEYYINVVLPESLLISLNYDDIIKLIVTKQYDGVFNGKIDNDTRYLLFLAIIATLIDNLDEKIPGKFKYIGDLIKRFITDMGGHYKVSSENNKTDLSFRVRLNLIRRDKRAGWLNG